MYYYEVKEPTLPLDKIYWFIALVTILVIARLSFTELGFYSALCLIPISACVAGFYVLNDALMPYTEKGSQQLLRVHLAVSLLCLLYVGNISAEHGLVATLLANYVCTIIVVILRTFRG